MAQVEESDVEGHTLESLRLYEAQFFGFTPQTCMMRIHSAFLDCLYEMLLVVESVVVKKLSRGKEPTEELCLKTRESTQKLLQFLQERFKILSSRMESLLVNSVLSIPPNVLLPEDQSHQKYPQSTDQLMKLESSVAQLQKSYQAEVCAKQALLAELEEQKETQHQLEDVLKWIEELRSSWKQEGMGNVQGSFCHVMETVAQLQDIIGKVGKKTKRLDEL
ncbi:protein MIS12 homolog [Chanos chanos]|uniref:Protein MIS12 homolog n=1 Tax=Chanos chanos TaxID=29144 RepID=A0A6J2WXH6_CHACN|nr:protein MIS12 homolog [Chanos chanos]